MPLKLNRGRHSTLGRTTRKTTRKDVDWVAEMQKILDEKKKEGLVGFHFSLGLLPGETCKYTKQQIAKEIQKQSKVSGTLITITDIQT